MSRAILFIPGILQNPDGVDDWADAAVAWVHCNTPHAADRYEYRCGAVTRWLGQGRRVRDLALLCGMYARRALTLVGHSNGCELILRTLREHAQLRVDAVHLFAAAADPDFDRNGLNAAAAAGRVGRAYVYCSRNDRPLKLGGISRKLFGCLGLGYGDLGRVGPKLDEDAVARCCTSVMWRSGFGHSTWFERRHLEETLWLATRN